MIIDKLSSLDSLPMHMPGHKRNTALAPYLGLLGAGLDATEISGLDDLHCPEGIIAEAQNRAAAIWGSERAFMLINGSTCGILAGIRALTHRGNRVIISRGAHRSVFHAIELCGLEPVFVCPPIIDGADIFGSLPPEEIAAALDRYPDARLVVVTSPTYEGVISDISGICAAAHAKGVPVLVDEAHGAHLGLSSGFPQGAVRAGADVVVQSLHKTLPSLTQTAVMHVSGSLADTERIRHQLAVFETSSPSYLLMASIDGCINLLSERPELLDEWAVRLAQFDAKVHQLDKLKAVHHGYNVPCFAHDISKIPIYTGFTGMSGYELADILRGEFGIEPEYALPRMVLAMTGAGDTGDTLDALAEALIQTDRRCSFREPAPGSPISSLVSSTELTLPPEQALERSAAALPVNLAAGRICAEYVWAYPPGIPLLIPGERISAHVAASLASVDMPPLRSTSGLLPEFIRVVK